MLIAIFMGTFGIWMALLSAVNFFGRARRPGAEGPSLKVNQPASSLPEQRPERSPLRAALEDLWSETLRGA